MGTICYFEKCPAGHASQLKIMYKQTCATLKHGRGTVIAGGDYGGGDGGVGGSPAASVGVTLCATRSPLFW